MRRRGFLILFLSAILALSSAPVAFAQEGTGVDLVLDPPTITGEPGDTLTLNVKAMPNNQKFAALDVCLNFDPASLEVIDADPTKSGTQITPGNTLPLTLNHRVDNQAGEIDFSAGFQPGMDTSPAPFIVATVNFKIKAGFTGQTAVIFSDTFPRATKVAYQGGTVWHSLTGASVGVNAEPEPVEPIVKPPPPPPPPPQPPTSEPQPNPTPQPSPEPTQTPTTPNPTTAPAPSPGPSPSVKPVPSPAPAPATNPAQQQAKPPAASSPAQEPTPEPGIPWWVWVIVGVVVVVATARLIIWKINKPG